MCYSEGLDMAGVFDLVAVCSHEGARTNHSSRIIYIKLQRNLSTSRIQLLGYLLRQPVKVD